MSDDEIHTVHMAAGHFEAYKRWLAVHHLEAVVMPVEIGGVEGENHYFVGVADDHPSLVAAKERMCDHCRGRPATFLLGEGIAVCDPCYRMTASLGT